MQYGTLHCTPLAGGPWPSNLVCSAAIRYFTGPRFCKRQLAMSPALASLSTSALLQPHLWKLPTTRSALLSRTSYTHQKQCLASHVLCCTASTDVLCDSVKINRGQWAWYIPPLNNKEATPSAARAGPVCIMSLVVFLASAMFVSSSRILCFRVGRWSSFFSSPSLLLFC